MKASVQNTSVTHSNKIWMKEKSNPKSFNEEYGKNVMFVEWGSKSTSNASKLKYLVQS